MGDPPTGPAFEVGFSIQPAPEGADGSWIGIHWNTPLASYAIGVPLAAAEELAYNFPRELTKTIAQAKRQASGLVVAPESTLHLLKGKD